MNFATSVSLNFSIVIVVVFEAPPFGISAIASVGDNLPAATCAMISITLIIVSPMFHPSIRPNSSANESFRPGFERKVSLAA